MEYEEFESDLGNVAVTKDHIEREERKSENWEKIRENFSADELLDKIHFSSIQELEFRQGMRFPNIRVKVEGDWKRMFFHEDDEAEECFKNLRYRWKAFRQIYQ